MTKAELEVEAVARATFAWTPGAGYHPQYVNLTGNRLTVRGPEFVNVFGHYDVGPTVSIDLPDEVIAELAASLPQDKRIAVLEEALTWLEPVISGEIKRREAVKQRAISAERCIRAALNGDSHEN